METNTMQTGNLPNWPSAAIVYSKAYAVLARMAERGHATPAKFKRYRNGRADYTLPGHVSEDMTRLIKALNAGDEEQIKGLLLMDWIYPRGAKC